MDKAPDSLAPASLAPAGTTGSVTSPPAGHSIGSMGVYPRSPEGDQTRDGAPSIRVSRFSVRSEQGPHLGSRLRDRTHDKSLTPAAEDDEQDQGTSVSNFGPTPSGVQIQVEASGVFESEEFPDGFKFTQTIETNDPLHGASSPYVDPQPNDDSKPFYWTDAEHNAHLTTFIDAPSRAAPSGADPTFWQGTLGLNGVNESTKTVTGVEYLTYGFSLDSSGVVTTRPPESTGGGNHIGVLSGGFSDWTFN